MIVQLVEKRNLKRKLGTELENFPSTLRGEQGNYRMKLGYKGFTLIELLVVIAIIGILAAIILPVYASARKSAYRSADMSSMNQLRTALGLYRVDQGGIPPALLGYVTLYSGTSNVVPADQLQSALYPKRINSLSIFTPALDRVSGNPVNAQYEQPYWPNGPVGTTDSSQAYGPTSQVTHCDYTQTPPAMVASNYYSISGYDIAEVPQPGGQNKWELHYAPFWSYDAVPSTCDGTTGKGSATDSPRQLGYSDPPDSTVVTWDSFFRDYGANGQPLREKQDIVLFLAGDARPYDSLNVYQNSWQVMP
jgi:prepilin-type N-terminal cleavage/methylation domain-containing protein